VPRVRVIEIGERFGRLIAMELRDRGKMTKIWCRCDCGVEKILWVSDITSGKTRSCGCFHREATVVRNLIHGMSHHELYQTYTGMLARCHDPQQKQYPDYGGRGITVCQRWRDGFENFVEDMGERPPGRTLDRENNDDGYSPENCRWATPSEQVSNRRGYGVSHYRGVSWIVAKNKWRADKWIDGRSKHLGYFSTEEEAAQAVN